MRSRANLIAGVTFVAGLVGFHTYAKKVRAEASGGEPLSVLVYAQDLSPGATLSESSLAEVVVPSGYVDGRRVAATEKKNLLGVAIEEKVHAGESLMWSDLADGSAHKHLAALVTPGKRAYSIAEDANPLGRLLRVADHVDVLEQSGGETSTLLERILVLAVGGHLEQGDGAPNQFGGSGVTLSVTSVEANLLLAAQSRGTLRLVLRNPQDQVKSEKPQLPLDTAAVRSRTRESKKEIEHVR